MSAATITSATRELIDLTLLQPSGKAPSRGGRPAELLQLVAESAHMVGAKVTGRSVIGVITDFRGNLLASFEESFDARTDDIVGILGAILLRHVAEGPGILLGVGLGVPGMVDSVRGGHVTAPTLGWTDVMLGAGLQEVLGVPVIVENDVHTLAVAESLFGSGREVGDFITVTIGQGIGCGIVVGGELHRGSRGGAAELGHNQVVLDGPTCGCGRRGCLEALSSDPAIISQAIRERLVPVGAGIEELRELATSGAEDAVRIFVDAGRHLGRATAALVNLLAPELVLISGEGTASWALLEPGFTAGFADQLLSVHGDVQLVVDPWEDLNWARGAVSLLMRSLFAPSAADGVMERLVRSRQLGSETSSPEADHGR